MYGSLYLLQYCNENIQPPNSKKIDDDRMRYEFQTKTDSIPTITYTHFCTNIIKQYSKGSIVIVLLGTLKLFIPPSHFKEVDSDRRRVGCRSAYYNSSVIVDSNSTKRPIPESVILFFVKAFGASLWIYLPIPPSTGVL